MQNLDLIFFCALVLHTSVVHSYPALQNYVKHLHSQTVISVNAISQHLDTFITLNEPKADWEHIPSGAFEDPILSGQTFAEDNQVIGETKIKVIMVYFGNSFLVVMGYSIDCRCVRFRNGTDDTHWPHENGTLNYKRPKLALFSRPWYQNAMEATGSPAFAVPYLAHNEETIDMTVSRSFGPDLNAVAAIDVSSSALEKFITSAAGFTLTEDNNCFVFIMQGTSMIASFPKGLPIRTLQNQTKEYILDENEGCESCTEGVCEPCGLVIWRSIELFENVKAGLNCSSTEYFTGDQCFSALDMYHYYYERFPLFDQDWTVFVLQSKSQEKTLETSNVVPTVIGIALAAIFVIGIIIVVFAKKAMEKRKNLFNKRGSKENQEDQHLGETKQ